MTQLRASWGDWAPATVLTVCRVASNPDPSQHSAATEKGKVTWNMGMNCSRAVSQGREGFLEDGTLELRSEEDMVFN